MTLNGDDDPAGFFMRFLNQLTGMSELPSAGRCATRRSSGCRWSCTARSWNPPSESALRSVLVSLLNGRAAG